nr:unnamed protein product [Spirometra erinaceieuropaei]
MERSPKVISPRNQSEIEEVFKRLQTHKGTKGLIAATSDGVPIRSTMEDGPTHTYCALVQRLVSKCSQSLKELDPTDDLTFLRIRTAKNEIMVAPEANYFLIVVQENS